MMGGEFATASRTSMDAVKRADHLLGKGVSRQNVAVMTGLSVADQIKFCRPRTVVVPSGEPVSIPIVATNEDDGPLLRAVLRAIGKLTDTELRRVIGAAVGILAPNHSQGDVARLVVHAHQAAVGPSRVLAKTVIEAVAAEYGLTYADMVGKRRAPRFAQPRQHAYWAVKQRCPHLSYVQIGGAFGGRDHTTIIHGIRAHEKRMAEGKA